MTIEDIREINRLEPLRGCYYPIPEEIYGWVPIEYRYKKKFSLKNLIGVVISILIFVGTTVQLFQPDVALEYKFAAIPLYVIALLIFVISTSSNLYIEEDTPIVEGEVRKVEEVIIYLNRKFIYHIADVYVPVINRVIKVCVHKDARIGTHILMVNKKNSRFVIHMSDEYSQKYKFLEV